MTALLFQTYYSVCPRHCLDYGDWDLREDDFALSSRNIRESKKISRIDEETHYENLLGISTNIQVTMNIKQIL